MMFEDLYKRLNNEQKRAVDTIDGPVMVIAGPGTGKTQILTLRIANILKKTDVGPESILALTFTESGAYAMRKRLVDIIGSAAYKINIFTFHGFCNEVIKTYPEVFPRIIGANSITDIDQIRIIEEIISSSSLPRLKPYGDPLYYLKPALSQIKNLKRENVSPENLKKIIAQQEDDFKKTDDLYYDKGQHKGKMKGKYKDLEKDIEKNKDLLVIYTEYEKQLQKQRLFDFEDMIMEVVRILKSNNDLLLRLQEKYQYILADEHQDANQGQNTILELLSGFFESPNLFIVGDEKQAIYRFQGASLENFLYFKKLYPSAVLISLVHNYRSTQAILDGAYSLISNNRVEDEKLRVELQAYSNHIPQKIKIYSFTKGENEYLFLKHDIEEKIKKGIPTHEICILFRDNKDVFPIVKVLEKTSIPFSVESGQNILDDDEIIKLTRILRAINDLGNNTLLSEFLFIDFLELNNLDVYKVLTYSKKERKLLYDVLCCEEFLIEAGVEDKEKILHIYSHLSQWSSLAKNKNIVDFFEIIVRESGFLNHVFALPGSLDTLNKLELFFNEIKKVAGNHKQYRLQDLIKYLDTLEDHKVLIKIDSTGNKTYGVRLMTAHKSKGLEFDYVYIVGVCDGHWGNKRSVTHFRIPLLHTKKDEVYDPIEDERRLFYVALTRARKEVNLTWCKESLAKKEQLPSQFISEIGETLSEVINMDDFEVSLPQDLSLTFSPKRNYGADIKDKKYLQQLFFDQGLSVTALNNYLQCPWNYFFENLVRLPSPQSKHQMYGTSVHEALKLFFDKYRSEEDLTKKEFLTYFEDFLKRKPFEQYDYEEALEKGKSALGGYYDTYKKTWSRNIITEFTITGIFLPFFTEDGEKKLLLRGQLDKIELGEGNDVVVIDYKTRKPLSRNEIEGKTKSSTGDYKRQLVFYKMLLDKYDNNRYSMKAGTIDFIEPDDNGNYKKEVFAITHNEVDELQKILQATAQSIFNLEFWNSTCGNSECRYCNLRKLMEK